MAKEIASIIEIMQVPCMQKGILLTLELDP